MGVSVRGHSDPHLHSTCPQCGYATRYKQWPTKCACSDAERQKVRTTFAPPHVVEIWAEQERKNAALPHLTGLPTLQIAPRYSGGGRGTTWLAITTFDIGEARRLAKELGFYPATTDPDDIERHRPQSAEADANHAAYLREHGPGGYKHGRWGHLKHK